MKKDRKKTEKKLEAKIDPSQKFFLIPVQFFELFFVLFFVGLGFQSVRANETPSQSDPKLKLEPTFQIKALEGEKSIEKNDVNYPKVFSTQGQVEITGKDEKSLLVQPGLELKEKAQIRTHATGQVVISLGKTRKVIILANSEVSIPSISWESGEAPILILRKGGIFWQDFAAANDVLKPKEAPSEKAYSIALTSGLFQFLAPAADFVLFYNSKAPKAEVRVVRGELQFSAMNAEESVQVHAGESVEFLGVLEGKEIAYDILLKGKRIPRGKLSSKNKFEVEPYLTSLVPEKPKVDPKLIQERQKKALKKKIDETRVGKFICIKPRGELNQCLWRLESKKCFRYRCDARGEWADRTWVASLAVCEKPSRVDRCDY